MDWFRRLRKQPLWIISASVGGLLVGIAAAGVLGFEINERVRSVTENALKYDVELEDRADDMTVAVLDMRHYHRNIVFAGPSRGGLADYDAAYGELLTAIAELEELGIQDPALPQPEQLRTLSRSYYTDFRQAIDLYASDPLAFTNASDNGLQTLFDLQSRAERIDRLSEMRATASLGSVEEAAATARLVLLGVLLGLVLLGIGLAHLVVRVLREQQTAAEQLEDALQAKVDFVADASHELRTPLTVLRANAEVALELDRSCVHTELLEDIVRESERMTHLIEDLLFLTLSDSRTLSMEYEQVEVEPFFVQCAERAAMLARQRGAALRTQLAAQGLAQIDRARIEQAVLILVDNAAKYSPSEEPVTLRVETRRTEIVVEVSDRGPGIPKEDLPLVFERFYRVDKARTRKQGGFGLGLAIARTIIEAHGGRIEAECKPNDGTRMRFYLPLSEAPPAPPARQPVGGKRQQRAEQLAVGGKR